MNKITFVCCMAVSAVLAHAGCQMKDKAGVLVGQTQVILAQNGHMRMETEDKMSLTSRPPVNLGKAFSRVVNEMRFLGHSGGTSMILSLADTSGQGDIASHAAASGYRGIKKLPVVVRIDKFSDETDMAAVLNDIYLLERGTDFKVTQINKEGHVLLVKGDIYGT